MRPRRGFTRQEPWIPLLIVVILAALAVPRLLRVRRELAARALLRQDVERLAQAERDARQRGAAPGSTLASVPLSPNARLVLKRAAAVGLAIEVWNDSLATKPDHCGAIVAPDGSVGATSCHD